MTTSPGDKVGASCVSTYVSKARRLSGPSITHGALSSWQRRPATKVCVFQCPKGAACAQALALATATAQPGHLGVHGRLVQKHQAVRLLAHAGLTLVCQTRRSSRTSARAHSAAIRAFFIREAVPAQEAREGSRGSDDPVLLEQPGREFRHGDVRLGLDRLDQERLIRRQPSASGGRPCRAGAGDPDVPDAAAA